MKNWIEQNLLPISSKKWKFIIPEEIKGAIISLTNWIPNNFPFNSRIYVILNNFSYDDVLCPVCRKNLKRFINFKKGFGETCSRECAKIHQVEAFKKTCLEKYGVENPNKLKETVEKSRQTRLDKYGSFHSDESKQKKKETTLKRYGVEYALQSETFQLKRRKTCKERFGIDNPSALESQKEKVRRTCLEKYGVDNPAKCLEIKEKIVTSTLKNNGNDFYKENRRKVFEKSKKWRYSELKEQLFERKHIELLSSKEEFVDNENFLFKCHICGRKFWHSGTNYQDISCECRKQVSFEELNFLKWLESLNINIMHSERKLISPYELDIYIPSHELAIEFDGLYWHSDLYKSKNYHLNKTLECEKKGVQLLHIFENEWHDKPEVVKSIILSKLRIFEKVINSEECEIKEISDEYAYMFYKENWIGQHINGKHLGFFFNDELIHVCTLKDEIVECFASKIGVKVENWWNNFEAICLDRRFYWEKEFPGLKTSQILESSLIKIGKFSIWDCGKITLIKEN